jgi:hypothetical protein
MVNSLKGARADECFWVGCEFANRTYFQRLGVRREPAAE